MKITRYKFFIIALYAVLFPLFFVLTPHLLQYDLSAVNIAQTLYFFTGTFFVFYLLDSLFKYRKIGWQKASAVHVVLVSVYALVFAIPEEIIFRGIIQGFIQDRIGNPFLIILISSAVFGLAHLANGAKGLSPKKWNWTLALVVFLAGFPLGLNYYFTQDLLIPTLLHVSFIMFLRLFTKDIVK